MVERIVVYDPRSLARIWLLDETTDDYIPLPYRVVHPDMTYAQSVAARAAFRDAAARDRSERRLFDNLDRIRAIEAQAKSVTARRRAERTVQAQRSRADQPPTAENASRAGRRSSIAELRRETLKAIADVGLRLRLIDDLHNIRGANLGSLLVELRNLGSVTDVSLGGFATREIAYVRGRTSSWPTVSSCSPCRAGSSTMSSTPSCWPRSRS